MSFPFLSLRSIKAVERRKGLYQMTWGKRFLVEVSGKIAHCCSKYFFDHSKVRFIARVGKREYGLQNRMTAAPQHRMILFSELLFRVFQSSVIGILTMALSGCAGLYFHRIPRRGGARPRGGDFQLRVSRTLAGVLFIRGEDWVFPLWISPS